MAEPNPDLSLDEAAKHLGIPAGVLHSWAWSKTGPKSNGSYWKPRFNQISLDEWKRTQGAALAKSIG